MKIRIIPSCCGGCGDRYFLTSFLVGDRVAIDAGSIGIQCDVSGQSAVRDVLLTHSHIDHVASLPVFLENTHGDGDPTRVWGHRDTLGSLKRDVFNDRVWPDLLALGDEAGTPFLEMRELTPEAPVRVAGLELTPVLLDHPVPTLGFLVDDGRSCVAIVADTGPTERIWELLRARERLDAVFVEASFPDELDELAGVSGHLTPRRFRRELEKLGRDDVDVIAYHIKARYHDRVVSQLEALGLPRLRIGSANEEYEF